MPFGVPLTETFLPQNLKAAGYHTALFGKWHLGFYQWAYTPLARGFDEHIGYFQGAIDYYTHVGGAYGGTKAGVDWHRGNQTTDFSDSGKYVVDLIVPEALSFLKRMGEAESKQPYFLYLPFHLIVSKSNLCRVACAEGLNRRFRCAQFYRLNNASWLQPMCECE